MELLSDADLGLPPDPVAPPAGLGGAGSSSPGMNDLPPDVDPATVLTVRRNGSSPAARLEGTSTTAPALAAPSARPVAPTSAPAAGAPADHDGVTSAPHGLLSDMDLGIGPGQDTPHPGGVLSNASDDGYGSGILKGLGTAAIKGFGDVVGFPNALHGMADYLLARAEAKITGKPVDAVLGELQKAKAAQPGLLKAIDPENVLPAPKDVSEPILGLTGEYKPTTEPGRIAQAGAEAAFSSFGPGLGSAVGPGKALLAATPAMAAGNAAAGAVGQGVTDATGDPLLGLTAGLVGAGAATGGAAAARKVAGPAIMGVPGIDAVPIVGPRVAAMRDNAAAAQVLAKASDPAALRQFAATPAAPSDVPASPQTLAGAVGNDRGLFQAEKDARNVDNAPFNALDRAQSDAQQAAIRGGADPGANVFRPGQAIRQRLDAIDAAAQTAEDRLTAAHQDAVTQQRAGLQDRTIARGEAYSDQKAQADAATQAAHDRLVQSFHDARAQASQAAADASAPLRSLPPAEETGTLLRTAQQEATNAAKAERQRLYDLVPDTATIVASPVKQAKQAIAGAIDPHTGVQPSGAEASIWSDIDRLPPVVPFRSLQTLDSRVTAAMADARRNPNPNDPQAISRLTQLKSSVMDAIENGAENQAQHEAQLAEAGIMPQELTLESRMKDFAGLEQAQPIGGAATGTYGGPTFFPGQRPLPSRASSSSAPNLPRPVPTGAAPQSLVGFLRAAGGIREFGGELAARDLQRQFPGLVNNRSGMSLDRAREAAAAAGYLGHDTAHAVANTDVNDLLSAIDSHPVYSVHDQDTVLDRQNNATLRELQRSYKANAQEIRQGLAAAGVDPRSAPRELVHDASALMHHERLSWHEALAQARDDRLADDLETARQTQFRDAQEQHYNDPADADARERSLQAGAPDGADPGARVGGAGTGFSQQLAEALANAKAAHRGFKTTFDNPTVAPALADNGFRGQYTMPASMVPSRAVVAGPKGYETARAFLAGTGGDPRAVQAMQDAALSGLRKAMPAVGDIHPRAIAAWKSPERYGGALRALDEVSPGFSSRFDHAGEATQAALDLGLQEKQAVAAHQRDSARQAIVDNLARREALGQANQADRAQVSALLAESAASTRAGVSQARGIARDAHATPAGQFVGQGGARIDPVEVENAVGSMLKTGSAGSTRMQELMRSVAKDPDAVEGLRKAGVDWMVRTFQGPDGSASGAKLIDFIRDNRGTLKELYPTAQMSMFGAVARDIEANARWRTETAIKGGSDTVRNAHALAGKVKSGAVHTSMALVAWEGLQKGMEVGGLKGMGIAAATPTAYLINTLRSAGIDSVDKLYREMLLDPDKAKYLISKMPASIEGGKLRALSGLLRRELVVGSQAVRSTQAQR